MRSRAGDLIFAGVLDRPDRYRSAVDGLRGRRARAVRVVGRLDRARDASVGHWFFEQRTSGGNSWSAVGTWLAETPVVVGLGIVAARLPRYRRRWHEVTLVAGGLLVEISVYLIVVLTVDRPRPGHRLETRMTGSYPSGHVAASIVLYGLSPSCSEAGAVGGCARGRVDHRRVIPFVVAVSRLYREMHHFSDVIAGALIGLGVLAVAALLARHVGDPPEHDLDPATTNPPEGVAV